MLVEMTPSDLDLLQQFTRDHAQDAFTELVQRHVNLVHSAALRQVRSPQLAEEVAQSVFADLARDAGKICGNDHSPMNSLTPWLHAVTRRTAIDVIRKESRRQLREQIAHEMNATNAPAANWNQIEPLLDEAVAALDDTDRAAVLLRYFENQSLRDVGQQLGLTDDAAQKRVSRAVEKLREFFTKRGVSVGASGLVVVISANAVSAAPVGLAATISATAIAGTAISTATVIAATKTIAMTTLQKTFVTAAFVAAAGAGIFEARQAAQLREQNQTLQQSQAPLTEKIQQLQRERDDATHRLAAIAEDGAKVQSNNSELLKLRNEITLLKRRQAVVPTVAANVQPPANEIKSTSDELGRELGEAVVLGDAGAFEKLLAESQAEYQSFKTNSVGLDDTQRGELSTKTFAPINAAFQAIADAANHGSQSALDALARALKSSSLRGLAVHSLGGLAGNGDAGALDVLIHPTQYGALLSSTISELQFAANNGNQQAIDALAAVANNPKNHALWYETADSLAQAAAAGNTVAVDALITMSSSTNQNVWRAVSEGLRGAAANQNAKAAQALQAMGAK